MTSEASGAVVVRLPQPTGRRLRLGPFPSARDALKFVTYAAVGGVVAGLLNPLAWLPFVGGGFVFAVYQPDGRGLDRWMADYLRWRWRSRGSPGGRRAVDVRGPVARAADGRIFAVLAAGGVPVAFLPPDDARRVFDRYRDLLRASGDRLYVRVSVEPLTSRSFVAPDEYRDGGRDDGEARAGYTALVRAVCRRRFLRRVDVVLCARSARSGDLGRLETEISAIRQALGGMGVASRRLRGVELAGAVRRAGFAVTGSGHR